MNKKILIGSIIALCILIGVSFTSVVGYRSVDSDVKASPLFNIRSRRAIGEESKGLTSKYVGKGELTNIYVPKTIATSKSLDTLIIIIKRMDDNALQEFSHFIAYHLFKSNELQGYSIKDVFQSLKLLRDEPDSIKVMDKVFDDTWYFSCSCPDTSEIKRCLPLYLLLLIGALYIITFAIAAIGYDFITSIFNCPPPSQNIFCN
jgi:hypothetical protein